MIPLDMFHSVLFVPFVTFVITVLFKGTWVLLKTGKIDYTRALGSGGMPSVHSSVVVSLSTAIALKHGVYSDLFAISLTFMTIIIYDAINVRFEAGRHAAALNKQSGEQKYNESLGHLPSEAFAGSILGVVVAITMFYIF